MQGLKQGRLCRSDLLASAASLPALMVLHKNLIVHTKTRLSAASIQHSIGDTACLSLYCRALQQASKSRCVLQSCLPPVNRAVQQGELESCMLSRCPSRYSRAGLYSKQDNNNAQYKKLSIQAFLRAGVHSKNNEQVCCRQIGHITAKKVCTVGKRSDLVLPAILASCSCDLGLLVQQVANEHQALCIEVDVLIWAWWILQGRSPTL